MADWNAVGTEAQLVESSDFMAPITVYASTFGGCRDAPGWKPPYTLSTG